MVQQKLKPSEPTFKFELKRDALSVPMRDGTKLMADLYLPHGDGPWPTLLERTPYNKESSPEVGVKSPQFYASRGYAVVLQDVRGRFKSEGTWYPFAADGWGALRDGYDTVEWLATQPWCGGRIGTIGGSYSGYTQYAMAGTNPPHLTCQFPRESVNDFRNGWVYRGGAMELGFCLRWSLLVTHTNLVKLVPETDRKRHDGILATARQELDSWCRHLPLRSMPLLDGLADWFYDHIDHPDDGPYWWQWNVSLRHSEVGKPMYHMGGWFDGLLNGTISNFNGVRRNARSEHARKNQKLIIGPWVHGPSATSQTRVGEIEFGPAAAIDFNEMRLPWFDYWLKDRDTGVMDEPPVKFFTMGVNRWQTAESWPPPDVRPANFYFEAGPSGSAKSLNDGRLQREGPDGAGGADSYLYDPNNPVPTRGGSWLMPGNGPHDQRPVEPRCLTYTSEPLPRDLEVSGHVVAVLHAMSSAPDTDWILRLCDVEPDGLSRPVAEGILRARYRESHEHPRLMTPNTVYRFDVDLWHTSNVFRAGHRIRVAVTSSCFPRWDRNLNTGGPFGKEAFGRIAHNTVFRTAVHPSHLVLPVRG
ncbi:MAG: CocE/NonD family hydrolase [Chloroflexi bacterium]|nr:CocE/NonD family hydrolase [Chloroflexota bacterium]